MKKHKEFNLQGIITLKEYESIIAELSTWYQENINEIQALYDDMLKSKDLSKSLDISKKHQSIIIDLVSKVIKLLKIEEKNIGVYISNSFAKGTNLIDSDIDINFIYEDQNLKVYEELVSSILFRVLGKYRDFIHDSIAHRFIESDLTEEDTLDIILNFSDGEYKYSVTKGNIKLMDKLLNTNNKLDSFIKYYIEMINSDITHNWIYFQKLICGDNAKNLLDYISELENKNNSYNLTTYKEKLINDINKELEVINSAQINDISLLKRHYKNHAYRIIYDFLVILRKVKGDNVSFKNIPDLIDEYLDIDQAETFKEYFGTIMILNYVCDLYGIEFRTRYSNPITNEFMNFYKEQTGWYLFDNINEKIKSLYSFILNYISTLDIKDKETLFDVKTEHINIPNYSPLSHINNVSKEYQNNYFLLPIIEYNGEYLPVHPDTVSDLNIDKKDIVDNMLVYPTSSTRTVYDEENNVCYKLAVLRQITRSIRDVSYKEITRSEKANEYLAKYSYPDFHIIPEVTHKFDKEIYNYIKRYMPEKRVYPWFYLIISNKFPKELMMNIIRKIVGIWAFYASKGIYFESFHTQNILADEDGHVYYRDLSDIRILDEEIMRPSYLNELANISELHSIFFDRSVISQNLDYFIKYRKDITDEDINLIKEIIDEEMHRYNITFPDYSMNYDKNRSGHHPVKCKLVDLRKR